MLGSDDACCCGSVDDWLFFVHRNGGCSLMNPFSKATRDLPKLDIEWFNPSFRYDSYFTKLAVPSPMQSSPGSFVAALILDGGGTIRIFQQSIGTYLAIAWDVLTTFLILLSLMGSCMVLIFAASSQFLRLIMALIVSQ
jgi:hypothetical protein